MAKDTETRKLILFTSARLFGERSFTRVSVRDIARHVGVTPASLYYYFESKEDILDDLIKHFIRIHEHFCEGMQNKINQPNYEPKLADLNYEYSPEDWELTFWITRIIYMEQYNYPLAAQALVGASVDQIVRSYQSFFKVLADKGYIKNRRRISRYIQLLLQISRSYQLDYTHPDIDMQPRESLRELYANTMKMILYYEGTVDMYRNLIV